MAVHSLIKFERCRCPQTQGQRTAMFSVSILLSVNFGVDCRLINVCKPENKAELMLPKSFQKLKLFDIRFLYN